MYSLPVLGLALVAWAVVTQNLRDRLRRASLVATILLVCGAFTLLRTGGIVGDGRSDFRWRWSATPEEKLLAQAPTKPAPAQNATQPGRAPAVSPDRAAGLAEWPGFRGAARDGVIHDVRIDTNWSHAAPAQIWRKPIGPGWSSFAVSGGRFYTQEQRGEEEVVACYQLATAEPVWQHADAARFWESNAGAGPRATPTLVKGRVYTLGGTGLLNVLEAADGSVVWSRNAATDTDTKVPGWGFSGSPLVLDDVVIVAASGKIVAYEINTGKPRWFGPARGGSYSSPHRATIGGIDQVLMLSGAGVAGFSPTNGAILWEYAWRGASIVQPALAGGGDLLISTGGPTGGLGLRRVAVTHGSGGWAVEERWRTTGLKPYFNDLIVYQGHAFGFDGSLLACVDLKDGQRRWKGGRYGYGQLVLLGEQGLLLVISEKGELALVSATPDEFREITRSPGIQGKTWNHPAFAGDLLLVRNSEEMAAFRLALAK